MMEPNEESGNEFMPDYTLGQHAAGGGRTDELTPAPLTSASTDRGGAEMVDLSNPLGLKDLPPICSECREEISEKNIWMAKQDGWMLCHVCRIMLVAAYRQPGLREAHQAYLVDKARKQARGDGEERR